ncbi:hypothetical protein ACFFRR_011853 [Megaselia abdita]
MKIFAVLLSLPLLGLCEDLTFRKPPNCMGTEEAMPKQQKCVSTIQNCGGGIYSNGQCVCNTGYMRAGQTGKICIPRCTGETLNCVAAGGSCDAVNFCNCGLGKAFVNGQCINSANDACGGKCFLGTCQSDGSCVCPQDYKLNADKTNCEPVGNCPYYSIATLPDLCQCIGNSYYSNGICKDAPTTPAPVTTTTTVKPQPTSTTIVELSTSTPFFLNTSTIDPECSCSDIQSVMKEILDELSKLESGF